MTKVCSKCGEEKDITEFYKRVKNKDGYSNQCKSCQYDKMKEYRKKEKYQEYQREYMENYGEENYDKLKAYRKKYYNKNKEKIRKYKQYYNEKNKDRNKEYQREYKKNRRDNDINYKILSNIRHRINLALKENWKSGHTLELLGCSISHFKLYLELQFPEEMNWDNYGEWHIDHIIPCDNFDLSNLEEQKKCFHYTNLQPLWAEDNLKKGNKVE